MVSPMACSPLEQTPRIPLRWPLTNRPSPSLPPPRDRSLACCFRIGLGCYRLTFPDTLAMIAFLCWVFICFRLKLLRGLLRIGFVYLFPLYIRLQLWKHRRIRLLFFVLFVLRFGFSGFVYAIASAACEFVYHKNNQY